MFLFLRKYDVEMSRAESPVSSYTCADLAAPNWRRRIGGAELSHSVSYLQMYCYYFISSDHRDQIFMRSNLQFVDVCCSFQCIFRLFCFPQVV